ncbi:RsmD family RNA methyltransferase [Acidisphaera sp. S103]|uniref:RsmD family RNA methyltransferase n=1 Tax=Acidisphaera sp. S103 TaxID=1747223 RepID=UPI00131E0EEE|nr:RsmD family RNA methyltransferase [Acidisphaera sp. S103]
MRIVAGAWRGRVLAAPPGSVTRPTADRVRQALFDMLMHAEWGGRAVIEGAVVLDVFAGTGALGLEALSRGAASACFIENDPAALKALRTNVAACRAVDRVEVVAGDVFQVHGRASSGVPRPAGGASPALAAAGRGQDGGAASLVFLDPPYGQDLVTRALARLRDVGRIRHGALIVAETARDETWVPDQKLLADRQHGAARILVFAAD